MPHSKSAKKRVHQSEAKRLHNHRIKSGLRTVVKKFAAALEAGDATAAAAAYQAAQKFIDKTAAKQIIHKGTASRMKARMSARLTAAKAAKK